MSAPLNERFWMARMACLERGGPKSYGGDLLQSFRECQENLGMDEEQAMVVISAGSMLSMEQHIIEELHTAGFSAAVEHIKARIMREMAEVLRGDDA